MKVVHVSHTNPHCEYRIQRELLAISKRQDVDDLLGIGIDVDQGAVQKNLDLNINNLKLVFALLPRVMFLKTLRASLVYLEFVIRAAFAIRSAKPDVVHCHDAPALLPTFLCHLFGSFRIVYDAHELMMYKVGNTAISRFVIFCIERLAWKKIDHFITVGGAIEDWYLTKFGSKPATIIYNSPTPRGQMTSQFDENYLYQKFGIEKHHKVFVFVGAFTIGRSIDKTLSSFAKLPRELNVVFLGYGELRDKIVEAARVNSNIHFHEAVPNNLVVDFLSRCDFGICLSQDISLNDRFSMPNKLFAYIQSGIPVIASDLPEIKRIVQNLAMGVIIAEDCEDISDGVFELIDFEFEKNDAAAAEYLWPAQEAKLQKIYDGFVS